MISELILGRSGFLFNPNLFSWVEAISNDRRKALVVLHGIVMWQYGPENSEYWLQDGITYMFRVFFLTVISIIRGGLSKKFFSDVGWYRRIPIISFKISGSTRCIDTLNIAIIIVFPKLFDNVMISFDLTDFQCET